FSRGLTSRGVSLLEGSHFSRGLTSRGVSLLEERQLLLARVDHEHRQELGRLRLASIGADGVAVAGRLREALSALVCRHRSVIDLAADRPLNLERPWSWLSIGLRQLIAPCEAWRHAARRLPYRRGRRSFHR